MTSNIGEVGVDSIRLKGQRIEEMALGTNNVAIQQLPAAREAERLQKIESIIAEYPTQRIDYLDGRVNECMENIERIGKTQVEQTQMISDYNGHINMGKYRDSEITNLDTALIEKELATGTLTDADIKEHGDKVKALLKRFPPYSVPALKQQIVQCNEAIQRCIDVIKAENESIRELLECKAQCKQRDALLKKYGAVAEGG